MLGYLTYFPYICSMENKRQQAAKTINEKYIDKTFGVLKVIEFSHRKNGNRVYFKCLCLRCGGNTTIRSDGLLRNPKSCKHCINDLQREIAYNKYHKLRKYRKIKSIYKSGAKVRNIPFNLSLDDVIKLIDSECYYCGDLNSKGIDRIDNTKGYTKDNCVSCCKFCNIMKNTYTVKEVFKKIEAIYLKHLK